jgi:MinD-like ATPase involved in chromosome partitioning or flagellar assembly
MAVIAFASAKGSPGVTTTLAALAAVWPADRRLLVAELDPAGGDLAIWFCLRPEPGLVTLAAAGRRNLQPAGILAHSQAFPTTEAQAAGAHTRRVLVGATSAEQGHAALVALRGRLGPALAQLDRADVLVDCGRLDPTSGAVEVVEHADLAVLVTRPELSAVHHLANRLKGLTARSVSVLTLGDRPYSAREVADAVGAEALGSLPHDARAAGALAGSHPDARRVLRRSALLRSAASLADGLAQWMTPPTESTALARPMVPEESVVGDHEAPDPATDHPQATIGARP